MINKETLKFIIGNVQRESSILKDIKNPYTGELVAKIYYAQPNDIELAITNSINAFKKFKELPAYLRSEILEKTSEILRERKSELAKIMTSESGKPIMYSNAEIDRAIFTFKYASEEAKRIGGELIP
ncbi:MAG: aldehyde dehydrogenase family protein, partial [Bacteroidetes bacterium]|nr:aldehyde dehydrogenase family protein [Bacteroidota bacterium]